MVLLYFFSLQVCNLIFFWIGDDVRTIETNADVLLNACKDIGLVVNIGKTKYMEIWRHRGMIASAHIKIGSNSFGFFIDK